MNDETYEQLKDAEMQPVNVFKRDRGEWYEECVEPLINDLYQKVEKQQKLIDLCLEAVKRFGANHQTSYQQFLDEFHRINGK